MKFKKYIFLILIILIIICISFLFFNNKKRGNQTLRDYSQETFDIDKDVLPYTEEEIFTQLFDINNVIEINIDISDDELKLMAEDCKKYVKIKSRSPIYRKADLYITIKNTESNTIYTYKIPEVGIRQKGKTSYTCFNTTDSLKIDELIHFKIDFQETFTDESYYKNNIHNWKNDKKGKSKRENRTFATLKELEMKWNKSNDSTYIRDYYANEFYRSNGILSAHTNLSSVNISNLHLGVYTIYEPIDKIFLKKNLNEEDLGGDLYKCRSITPFPDFTSTESIGVDDKDEGLFYAYAKKTNKKGNHSNLINFIEKINGKIFSKEDISNLIDIDYFLKFAATSYFIGNPDDMRNDYNNFYIYLRKSDNKAIFIPFDNEMSFGVTRNFDPTENSNTTLSPFSTLTSNSEEQKNPLYIYTIDEGGYFISEYIEALKEVYNSKYLEVETFDKIYEIAKNNYEKYALVKKELNNRIVYNLEFNNSDTYFNMTFSDFIYRIKRTYQRYIK